MFASVKTKYRYCTAYKRRPEWKRQDFLESERFEHDLAAALDAMSVHHGSREVLDILLKDGTQVDAKQKKQPLSKRWHLLDGVPEENLFVLTATEVWKANNFAPRAFLVLKDDVTNRYFVATPWDVAVHCDKRVLRDGKEKWIIDLSKLHKADDLVQVRELIMSYPHKHGAGLPEVQA